MFKASNAHTEKCGEPPEVDADSCKYSSYFENSYGEQWLLWWDGDKVLVAGGDLDWGQRLNASEEGAFDRIVLSVPEGLWLTASLAACQDMGASVPRVSIELILKKIGFAREGGTPKKSAKSLTSPS